MQLFFGKSSSRQLGSILTLVLILLAAITAGVIGTGSTAAASGGDIIFTGRGWGHGRGLGQYGAYGYARDHGWSSAQILDHYYGGTRAGSGPADGPVDPETIRVDLRYMHTRPTVVGVGSGTIVLKDESGATIGQSSQPMVRVVSEAGQMKAQSGPGCDGPWVDLALSSSPTEIRLVAQSESSELEGKIHVCGPGYRVWYAGEIVATTLRGQARTVNVVDIEQYLRGVVPNEMPASWPSAALEAQAVAARSYALAGDSRQQPYADTCDTVLCQVYDGLYTERGRDRQATHPRTDAAIAATAGVVRLTTAGAVARTEFSSSTGGHTVGATFPAVVDQGDSISANPNHTWTKLVSVASIESRYNKGKLISIDVTKRNGLGADGGRVLEVKLTFDGGTVTKSGNAMRSAFGLKSDWFTPGIVGAINSTPDADSFTDWAYQRYVGREAKEAEVDRWRAPVAKGQRLALTKDLALSDQFAGTMVDGLYRIALGRKADPGGRAYWVETLGDGVRFEVVGTMFYGSAEYFERSGGTNKQYVTSLYRDILGRKPDTGGLNYWVSLLDRRRALPPDIAAGFYISPESRRSRALETYRTVIGENPSAAQVASLGDRLLVLDDLRLAAELGASDDAFKRAQSQ